MSTPNSTPFSPFSPSRLPRQALLVAGGLGVAGIGLAAGLMLHAPPQQPDAAPAATVAAAPSATALGNAARVDTGPHAGPSPTRAAAAAQARERPVRVLKLCGDCGVIERVRVVRHEGQGTGLGAVVGGVLGGVVGHQMGGGGGKTALTLLGAVGGGVAGNEIEKRQRAVTVYEMVVRMDDGSERRFTQASPVVPGTRVTVDKHGVHVAEAPRSAEPTALRTSAAGTF